MPSSFVVPRALAREPLVAALLPLRIDAPLDAKHAGKARTQVMEREMMEHMQMHRTMVSHMDNQLALFGDNVDAAAGAEAPVANAAGLSSPSQTGDYFTSAVDWSALDESVLENQLFEFLKE